MRCKTFNARTGSLTDGIAATSREIPSEAGTRVEGIVTLGVKRTKQNPHSWSEIIKTDNGSKGRRPAEIRNGGIYYAYPTLIRIREDERRIGKQFVVLSKPRSLNRMFLVRVNTSCKDKVIFGTYYTQAGKPRVITQAYGCDDSTHPDRTWCDDLVSIADGDAIRIEVQSGNENSTPRDWVLYNRNRKLLNLTTEAFLAMCPDAVEEDLLTLPEAQAMHNEEVRAAANEVAGETVLDDDLADRMDEADSEELQTATVATSGGWERNPDPEDGVVLF